MPGRGPARSRHVLGSSVPASSLVQLRSPQRAAVGGEAGLTLACPDVGWSEDWGADGQMSLGLLCPLPRRREEQPGSLQGALSRSSSRSLRPSPPTCGPSVSHAFRRTPLEDRSPLAGHVTFASSASSGEWARPMWNSLILHSAQLEGHIHFLSQMMRLSLPKVLGAAGQSLQSRGGCELRPCPSLAVWPQCDRVYLPGSPCPHLYKERVGLSVL